MVDVSELARNAVTAARWLVKAKLNLENAEREYLAAMRAFNKARDEDEGGVRVPLPLVIGNHVLDVGFKDGPAVVTVTEFHSADEIGRTEAR